MSKEKANSVTIHNRPAIEKRLMNAAAAAVGNPAHYKNPFEYKARLNELAEKALRLLKRKYRKHMGWTGSKYTKAHQGKKECARRREQCPGGMVYDCSVMGNRTLNRLSLHQR